MKLDPTDQRHIQYYTISNLYTTTMMLEISTLKDFSKAFNIIDHQIILSKLNIYDFRGITNQWFKSYLTNRKQCVTITPTRYSSDMQIIIHKE